ncbi:MAG TPA: hypothetical protein DDY20_09060 [Desulfobulbaceae bacterium]|nr:hypothetical protein [Desulfobulbaceae bacterium]
MITELRRSKRYNDFLPISVCALSGPDKNIISGPFSGRIVDISRHGACLLMTQVMLGGYHVFHSTMENDSRILQIQINIPPDLVNITLPSLPVWIKPYDLDEIKAFRLGVNFLVDPEGEQMQRLEQVMRRNEAQRNDLWTSMAMPSPMKTEKK